jgi:hypothetical protein
MVYNNKTRKYDKPYLTILQGNNWVYGYDPDKKNGGMTIVSKDAIQYSKKGGYLLTLK